MTRTKTVCSFLLVGDVWFVAGSMQAEFNFPAETLNNWMAKEMGRMQGRSSVLQHSRHNDETKQQKNKIQFPKISTSLPPVDTMKNDAGGTYRCCCKFFVATAQHFSLKGVIGWDYQCKPSVENLRRLLGLPCNLPRQISVHRYFAKISMTWLCARRWHRREPYLPGHLWGRFWNYPAREY